MGSRLAGAQRIAGATRLTRAPDRPAATLAATLVARIVGTRNPYSYRHDPAVPMFPDDRPVIVFDGHCSLCTGWARFVLKHDRQRSFRLLPAQSHLGRALYVHYGLDPHDYETNILIADGLAWFRSEGTIRMVEELGFPWSLAKIFRLIPVWLRDRLYHCIARNRLRLFGKRVVCYRSEPGKEDRFLA
jgi:predicted DCC family thiol-disulfide oxidoreductase YuxK